MSPSRPAAAASRRYARMIFTLPPELADEARRYADLYHQGNNSALVAAAIRAYLDHLSKVQHTLRLRGSYAAAARAGAELAAEWEGVETEEWPAPNRGKPARRS